MPRLISFIAIARHRLDGESSPESAIAQFGARWGQVEATAAAALTAFDRIDAVLPAAVLRHRIGVFSPEDTRAIRDALVGVPAEVVTELDADAVTSAIYGALRETTEEAIRRDGCLVVEIQG